MNTFTPFFSRRGCVRSLSGNLVKSSSRHLRCDILWRRELAKEQGSGQGNAGGLPMIFFSSSFLYPVHHSSPSFCQLFFFLFQRKQVFHDMAWYEWSFAPYEILKVLLRLPVLRYVQIKEPDVARVAQCWHITSATEESKLKKKFELSEFKIRGNCEGNCSFFMMNYFWMCVVCFSWDDFDSITKYFNNTNGILCIFTWID